MANHRVFLGYATMLLCTALWTASVAAVQALNRGVPDFELSIARYLATIFITVPWVKWREKSFEVPESKWGYSAIMCVAFLFFNATYFGAVSIIPMSHACAMLYAFRMLFVTSIMFIFEGVRPNFTFVVSISGCVVGMLFLVQPWLSFSEGFIPDFLKPHPIIPEGYNVSINGTAGLIIPKIDVSNIISLGYGLVVLAALVNAVYIHMMGYKMPDLSPPLKCLVAAVACTPYSLAASFYLESPVLFITSREFFFVSLHALGAGLGIILESVTCHLLDTTRMSILANLTCVMLLILQYTVMANYGLYGRRNALEVIGCVVIVGSVSLSVLPSIGQKHQDLS